MAGPAPSSSPTAHHRPGPTRRLLVLLVAAVAVALAGCGGSGGARVERAGPPETSVGGAPAPPSPSSTATPAEGRQVSAATAAALQEAAAESGLVRWTSPRVTVATSGSPTPRDLEVLAGALAELGALTGVELVLGPADEPDIGVRFAPRTSWPAAPEEGTGHVLGVTQARWRGAGELRSADVSIDSEIGQAARNQTIVHELLHALGLGHVSCATSIVYGGADGGPAWGLSPLDQQVVATWYDPDLATGSSAEALGAELEVVGDDPTCAPQLLEAAETSDGTIWCERRTGSMPCVLVDGLGPEPVPPLAADRWTLDGVVYDHDPERYEAFTFEGRRLLCERADGDRRPCQFTDGPGPLSAVDAWTDGQLVYESP